MALISLRLPPGIFRNGTKYQAKGRWFDANLVRWHEGAMLPWGGWSPILTIAQAVSAAISDDGGVFTDETADANEATADDVVLVPASPAVNDAFYIGYALQFEGIEVNTSTVATDGVVTWEYWNGSAWVALSGVVDNTNSFKVSSTQTVQWTRPTNWATTTVNSQGPFYYVRARVTTAGTTTALGTQVWIGVTPVRLGEPVRGFLTWRANDRAIRFAAGTPTKAWAYHDGQLIDITPAGFTTGIADAASGSAYGSGNYGAGPYGEGSGGVTAITEADSWQFDTFGEQLVAISTSDGKLYAWDLVATNDLVQMTGSPTASKGLVVTPERFVFALAADGDVRQIKWSDQEDFNTWTPTATNQAGDFILPGQGEILAGRRGRRETLIWTDHDLFSARYIGGVLVYTFDQVGANCGAISRQAIGSIGGAFIWMGTDDFYIYTGGVNRIPSDVSDFVFSDLNRVQVSKIWAMTIAERSKIIWFYPSSMSTECDRYVEFDVKEGHWTIGALERTAGDDRNVFQFPIMVDADGVVYDHERGASYLDPDGVALTPSAESGPVEIGGGDRVMDVLYVIPDDKTLGDVQARFFTSFFPGEAEVERGPFTLSKQTSVRFSGRWARLKVEQVNADWRVGVVRLDVTPGGRR